MGSTMFLVAAVALGVDAGWQPLPDGGLEYLIQIEPHMLESLKAGEEIASDIPPTLTDIRSYRITVGTGKLPREQAPKTAVEPELTAPREPLESAADRAPFPPERVPRELPLPTDTEPLAGQLAVFNQEQEAGPSGAATEPDVSESSDEPSSKPWFPLTLALAGLFGSTGGMLYLGWVAWDYRRRYKALLKRMIDGGHERLLLVDTPDSSAG